MHWEEATDADQAHLARAVDAEAWLEEGHELRPFLLDGWGRPGDLGVLGYIGNVHAAAAWARRFDHAPPALGFVDHDVPVLVNAWVRADVRNLGHGVTMLGRLLDLCRATGHAAVTLATDQSNPAVRLYLRLGFEFQSSVGARWQMIKRLD